MSLKRFKTNTPLWLLVSLVLFVPPWFILEVGTPGGHTHPSLLWLYLLRHPLNPAKVVVGLVVFTLIFRIAALGVGRVIHCLVVMARDRIRNAA